MSLWGQWCNFIEIAPRYRASLWSQWRDNQGKIFLLAHLAIFTLGLAPIETFLESGLCWINLNASLETKEAKKTNRATFRETFVVSRHPRPQTFLDGAWRVGAEWSRWWGLWIPSLPKVGGGVPTAWVPFRLAFFLFLQWCLLAEVQHNQFSN